jgi:hypothetical protein
MTGTKHQAKKAAACQAKKPNEKGRITATVSANTGG